MRTFGSTRQFLFRRKRPTRYRACRFRHVRMTAYVCQVFHLCQVYQLGPSASSLPPNDGRERAGLPFLILLVPLAENQNDQHVHHRPNPVQMWSAGTEPGEQHSFTRGGNCVGGVLQSGIEGSSRREGRGVPRQYHCAYAIMNMCGSLCRKYPTCVRHNLDVPTRVYMGRPAKKLYPLRLLSTRRHLPTWLQTGRGRSGKGLR